MNGRDVEVGLFCSALLTALTKAANYALLRPGVDFHNPQNDKTPVKAARGSVHDEG
jgi:hypothetical protein